MKLQLGLDSNKASYLHHKRDYGAENKSNSSGEIHKPFHYDLSFSNPNIAVFKGLKHSNKQERTINNSINTTTRYNPSGRVYFKGANPKNAATFAERVVKNKYVRSFCEMAEKNSALAEAVGALFITCGIRPLSIMAMPEKDADKNKKAASHSIASGVVGVVFAQILYSPFSAAMERIVKSIKNNNASKYLGTAAEFITKPGKQKIVRGVEQTVSNLDCFKQLVTYGPKLFTASILAAMTIGAMPYIDKYIIDKYVIRKKPNSNEKPSLMTYDHFKYVAFRSSPKEQAVFQNFKGALKS